MKSVIGCGAGQWDGENRLGQGCIVVRRVDQGLRSYGPRGVVWCDEKEGMRTLVGRNVLALGAGALLCQEPAEAVDAVFGLRGSALELGDHPPPARDGSGNLGGLALRGAAPCQNLQQPAPAQNRLQGLLVEPLHAILEMGSQGAAALVVDEQALYEPGCAGRAGKDEGCRA